MTDYTQMWADLGLDLEAHDALLNMLGSVYGDIYVSQKNRPEGMGYFDFVMSEIHGLRIKELLDAKAEGRKVIGSFCVFVPEELTLAVDGIQVGLCAGADFATDESEKYLPRSTCALIKSFFGFKLGKVCPYIELSDMVVGETTCDGKKKAYEIFKELQPNLYVLELPQMKNPQDREILKTEYLRFKDELEKLTGITINVDRLRKGIEIVNNKREALHRLAALRAADPAPISGLDALLINQVAFYDDPPRFTEAVNKICDELEVRIKNGEGVAPKGTPRMLISGCPMAVPNWKLPAIIESSGGIIVGEESCVGERGERNLVDESGDTLDALMDTIVDRYFQIDCAVYTPNPDRLQHIESMAKDYNADGVIHYSLQFCQPYMIESYSIEQKLREENIPVMRLETDYSQEDTGQLKTRIETFVEMVKRSVVMS
ncbi:MAG: 2-hydroxyacyl-CoA dehydratase [Chloroflexi bacterium]|nr:2-hydroxyacyl-CoA dehydratase [Chloroflexota bacterium]